MFPASRLTRFYSERPWGRAHARPRGSPFQLPTELAVGLDLGSGPQERLPAPVSPVLAPAREEFGSPVPKFRKEPGLRRLIACVLHDTTVMHAGINAILQGLKRRQVPHPQRNSLGKRAVKYSKFLPTSAPPPMGRSHTPDGSPGDGKEPAQLMRHEAKADASTARHPLEPSTSPHSPARGLH